MICSTQKSG